MKAGDRVTYQEVNRRDRRGTLVAIERTPRGGDCWVQWDGQLSKTEECLRNLTVLQP